MAIAVLHARVGEDVQLSPSQFWTPFKWLDSLTKSGRNRLLQNVMRQSDSRSFDIDRNYALAYSARPVHGATVESIEWKNGTSSSGLSIALFSTNSGAKVDGKTETDDTCLAVRIFRG